MKKIYFIYLNLFLFLLFNSCDWLDLTPIDYFGSGSFWKSQSQVEGYMLGIHDQLRNDYQSLYILGEARGGTSALGSNVLAATNENTSPIKDNTFTKDAVGITNWNGYYSRIMQVNLFISEVENGCEFLTDNDRNYFLGQAYGIRAHFYFMLYRTFGGVPIIKTVEVMKGGIEASKLYTPRATPKEVMDFIKDDINISDQNFGSNFTIKGGKSMWSKAATLMLKANIYLWSAKVSTGDQTPSGTDLQTAKDALTQLIGKFKLLPNFSDVFSASNKGNEEIILVNHFAEGEATNWGIRFVYWPLNFVNQMYGRNGELMPDTLDLRSTGAYNNTYKYELFESFDSNDLRRDATFLDFYSKDYSGEIITKNLALKKCLGEIDSNGNRIYVSDIVVYRYSEVLLLMAEIENKLGNDPSVYINEVRQRAYGTNYDVAIHGYTNQDFASNELAILYERDKEFVWEGKRWFDVCRMTDATGRPLVFSSAASYGTDYPILDYNTEAHKLLWPVDVNTLNGDPTLEQTPGY